MQIFKFFVLIWVGAAIQTLHILAFEYIEIGTGLHPVAAVWLSIMLLAGAYVATKEL